jgi:hypothetical protein
MGDENKFKTQKLHKFMSYIRNLSMNLHYCIPVRDDHQFYVELNGYLSHRSRYARILHAPNL